MVTGIDEFCCCKEVKREIGSGCDLRNLEFGSAIILVSNKFVLCVETS